MTLGELIAALEAANPTRTVRHGFTHPHSYRGYYNELAFEPAANVTVADMLADARSALGATYEGWKGGDFTMHEHTDCWLSEEGCASGDTISALLLELMLGSVAVEEPAASAPDTLPAWLYQRFAVIHGCASWDQIADGQRAYWEHQARAVRRAVARGGFKAVAPDAASEVTSAPLSASPASSVSESAQSPTGAPEGALKASEAAVVEEADVEPEFTEARAAFMQIGRTPSLGGLRTELRIEGWPPIVGNYNGAAMRRMHDIPGHEHLLTIEPSLIFEYADEQAAGPETPAEETHIVADDSSDPTTTAR